MEGDTIDRQWSDAIDQAEIDLEHVKQDHAYGGVPVDYWTHDEHIQDAETLLSDLTKSRDEYRRLYPDVDPLAIGHTPAMIGGPIE